MRAAEVLQRYIDETLPEFVGLTLTDGRREKAERKGVGSLLLTPALFELGGCYNEGELVSVDKAKAAQLFKRAAELKRAASQYTHAIDLLYGANGIQKDVLMGLKYLHESNEAKYRGTYDLLAYFYEKGEFGFPIDPQKAASLRAEADGDDVLWKT